MFDLKGKIALVTGGGRGLGFAIAEKFARSGAPVVVTGRSRSVLDQAVGKLESYGIHALAIDSDIAERAPSEPDGAVPGHSRQAVG